MLIAFGRRSVLCWNCRGEDSKSCSRNFRELIYTPKPNVMALLEPKVRGDVADRVCKLIGKKNSFRSKADRFRSGIWILWDGNLIELKVVHAHKQFVHLLVVLDTEEEWMLTVTYATLKLLVRAALWRE